MSDSIKLFSGFEVNRIIILGVLAESELGTDRKLYDDLEIIEKTQEGLPVHIYKLGGIGEFLVSLDLIFNRCKRHGLKPILHIECHGDCDKGLVFRDGFLSWLYLGNRLREINYATNNNLVVSLASCYGLKAYSEALRYDRLCPAWYAVAPVKEAKVGDLESFYRMFYSSISKEANMDIVDEIVSRCPVVESVYSAKFIVIVIARYLHHFCRGRKKKERVETLITMNKWINGNSDIESLRRFRDILKSSISVDEKVFKERTRIFLMDEKRAGCTWAELKSFVVQ